MILTENVIIGRTIPVGTGIYQQINNSGALRSRPIGVTSSKPYLLGLHSHTNTEQHQSRHQRTILQYKRILADVTVASLNFKASYECPLNLEKVFLTCHTEWEGHFSGIRA